MKTTSMRGVQVDMSYYIARNEGAIAVGNGNMNARGDQIGAGGQIVRKREEIAAEYHRSNPKAVQKVSLKDLEAEVFVSPEEAVAQHVQKANAQKMKDDAAKASADTAARKRKISESDN